MYVSGFCFRLMHWVKEFGKWSPVLDFVSRVCQKLCRKCTVWGIGLEFNNFKLILFFSFKHLFIYCLQCRNQIRRICVDHEFHIGYIAILICENFIKRYFELNGQFVAHKFCTSVILEQFYVKFWVLIRSFSTADLPFLIVYVSMTELSLYSFSSPNILNFFSEKVKLMK